MVRESLINTENINSENFNVPLAKKKKKDTKLFLKHVFKKNYYKESYCFRKREMLTYIKHLSFQLTISPKLYKSLTYSNTISLSLNEGK